MRLTCSQLTKTCSAQGQEVSPGSSQCGPLALGITPGTALARRFRCTVARLPAAKEKFREVSKTLRNQRFSQFRHKDEVAEGREVPGSNRSARITGGAASAVRTVTTAVCCSASAREAVGKRHGLEGLQVTAPIC